MKKQISTLLLLCAISPAFAEAYFEPQWNEFCPNQYINLDPEKDYILAEKKYWQQRKKEFDRKVTYCGHLSPLEKENCYNDLRRIEGNASATHIAEVRLQQEQINAAANMTSATANTMNAVNYQVNTVRSINHYGW